METHAHHLHKAPGKGFWHFFFEFLMLFIAVSLGFFVENLREHQAEKRNADRLSRSVVADLRKDSLFLEDAIQFSTEKINGCDSMMSMMSQPRENWDVNSFYKYLNAIGQSNRFFPTDGTYKQMTTSGALKYFDQSIVDRLNGYDVQTRKILYWADVEDHTLWLLGDITFDKINFQALAAIRFHNNDAQVNKTIDITDKEMSKFINLVALVKTYRIKTLVEYKEELKLCGTIIDVLKEK